MKPLVINQWTKGIGSSSVTGMYDMRNVDIASRPGKLILNYKTAKKSGTTITDLPKWFAYDTINAAIYCLDRSGDLYRSTDDGDTWTKLNVQSTSQAAGNGLAIWKGYLFVARNSKLDVFGALPAAGATLSWQSLTTDAGWHPLFVGLRNVLYIGNGNKVAMIEEKAGQTFDPSNSATYTFTSNALDLPSGYRIKCLQELRDKTYIGTFKSDSNNPKARFADIFPWDGSSSSYNLPLQLARNGVNAMLNINNTLYIQAGDRAEWFVSNGLVVQDLGKLPQDLIYPGGDGGFFQYPAAVMQHKGSLFFGSGINFVTSNAYSPQGVFSFTGKSLNCENIISTGNDGTSGQVEIGCLLGLGTESYLIGWGDSGTYGIDKILTSTRCSSYSGYAISDLYQVGTKINPVSFRTCEIQLARPLTTGQGVRIKWRSNLTASFTTLHTMDFATYGATTGGEKGAASIDNVEMVQVKAELTSTDSTTPELLAVILK